MWNVNETYFINFKNLDKRDSSVYTFCVKDSKNARCGGNFELRLTVLDEGNCLLSTDNCTFYIIL